MYRSDRCKQIDDDTFTLKIQKDRDFRILQLTDLHLGFGILSRGRDKLALNAVRKLIEKSKPDLIVLTGDSIFPFFPRSGTMNKRRQAKKLMAFFHMPLREFKEAYEKMKLGDKSVVYCHGSIAEKHEYFGISKKRGTFFERAVENGVIKWMFCGHDHMNTLSLVYKGIRMTYGMSIDYLGYQGIWKSHIQRGGTLITRKTDGSVDIRMVPLGPVVSTRVRGVKKNAG